MDSQLFSIFTPPLGLVFARACCLQLLMSGKSFWKIWAKMHLNGQIGHNSRGGKRCKSENKENFSTLIIVHYRWNKWGLARVQIYVWNRHTYHRETSSNCNLNLKHRPSIKLATDTAIDPSGSWMNFENTDIHMLPSPESKIDSANNENCRQLGYFSIINTLA